MAQFNTSTQFIAHLDGGLRLECGYRSDYTAASGLSAGDFSGTRCMPTTLTHQICGWIYCMSTSGGIGGCLTGSGPVLRDWSGTTTANADDTGSSYLCFTLETTSEESTAHYIAFGW